VAETTRFRRKESLPWADLRLRQFTSLQPGRPDEGEEEEEKEKGAGAEVRADGMEEEAPDEDGEEWGEVATPHLRVRLHRDPPRPRRSLPPFRLPLLYGIGLDCSTS